MIHNYTWWMAVFIFRKEIMTVFSGRRMRSIWSLDLFTLGVSLRCERNGERPSKGREGELETRRIYNFGVTSSSLVPPNGSRMKYGGEFDLNSTRISPSAMDVNAILDHRFCRVDVLIVLMWICRNQTSAFAEVDGVIACKVLICWHLWIKIDLHVESWRFHG